jgi:peptidoglycan hydrolase-like protein with peptidoglycan-binding domain
VDASDAETTDTTNASSTEEIQMDTNGDGVVDDQDTGTTTAEKQPTAIDLEDLTAPAPTQPSAQKAPTTAPAPTQPSAQKAPTATKVDTKDQLSKEKIICNPAEQLLVKDSSGNAVRVLQTILTQMGYDPKTIDGKFGPNTEKAVIQFQEKNGLVKDGKVGKNTWTKLCALYKQTKTTTLEDLIDGGDKAGGSVVPVRENEVCKITKLDLKSGDIGDDIVILQKNLKELGYYPYGVDLTAKKFGPQTEMSVRLFQISNKLPVTGIVDKITHEKICTASTDKNKNRQLILTNFVKNPNASPLDLLKGGQGFKQFKWHAADYLGNPVGPNEKETLKLVNQLNNIILEDRVNRQANAILIDAEYQKDKTGYNEYFKKNVKPIPDYPKHLLNKYALDSFVKMRQAAKGEGIEIVPLSTYRDPVADAKRAEEANNPNAIAKGISPHGLGVAIDIKMSDGNKNYKEITTYPFSNIMDMRSSSIYKWLVIFANDFNFHPFNQEPWHWEYNYKNFKPVYLSEFKK